MHPESGVANAADSGRANLLGVDTTCRHEYSQTVQYTAHSTHATGHSHRLAISGQVQPGCSSILTECLITAIRLIDPAGGAVRAAVNLSCRITSYPASWRAAISLTCSALLGRAAAGGFSAAAKCSPIDGAACSELNSSVTRSSSRASC